MTDDELDAIESLIRRDDVSLVALDRLNPSADRDVTDAVRELVAEVRRLRDALDTYGTHQTDCLAFMSEAYRCDCGFRAALEGEPKP